MPTTDLVPIAVYRTAVPGFIVRAGFCNRPSCAQPMLRVGFDAAGDSTPMLWCSNACASWGHRKRQQAERSAARVVVVGRCNGCLGWFNQVVHRNSATTTELYCSDGCRHVRPCEPCRGLNRRRPNRAICIECFTVIKRSCAGKIRYTRANAEHVASKRRDKRPDRETTAYHCWAVCLGWHIGSPVGEEHQTRIIAAAALLRQRLGPDNWDKFVAQLATSPRTSIAWLNGRPAGPRPASRAPAP